MSRFRGLLRRSALREALTLVVIFAVITALVWAGTYGLVQREIQRLVDARLTS
ncbi:MAG: hypothetical protein OIF48_00165 [Silicimonas sp.]|nr:hypothetical protein [Silicimonas sp.]